MDKPFDGRAVLELMGHRERGGYVREVEIAGARMLRIDILAGKDEVDQDIIATEFYGVAAIHALRPCAENVIRDAATRHGADPRPVPPFEYRERQAPAAIADQHEQPDF